LSEPSKLPEKAESEAKALKTATQIFLESCIGESELSKKSANLP
jgi:hypothetical protein